MPRLRWAWRAGWCRQLWAARQQSCRPPCVGAATSAPRRSAAPALGARTPHLARVAHFLLSGDHKTSRASTGVGDRASVAMHACAQGNVRADPNQGARAPASAWQAEGAGAPFSRGVYIRRRTSATVRLVDPRGSEAALLDSSRPSWCHGLVQSSDFISQTVANAGLRQKVLQLAPMICGVGEGATCSKLPLTT